VAAQQIKPLGGNLKRGEFEAAILKPVFDELVHA
jgi:hypothetical protein